VDIDGPLFFFLIGGWIFISVIVKDNAKAFFLNLFFVASTDLGLMLGK
jgi:hypothetical protein